MRRILKGKSKNLHKRPRVISVIGTTKGAGSTHFVIALAEAIRILYGRKTAVVELNGRNDFAKIEKHCVRHNFENKIYETEMYDIHNISYFKKSSHKVFFDIFGGDYQYIVVDIGSDFRKYRDIIVVSDIKCLIACHSPWKYEDNMCAIEWLDTELPKEKFKCFSCFGEPNNKKIFEQVPLFANPFRLDRKLLPFFMNVLED